jgi:hypothetical protein
MTDAVMFCAADPSARCAKTSQPVGPLGVESLRNAGTASSMDPPPPTATSPGLHSADASKPDACVGPVRMVTLVAPAGPCGPWGPRGPTGPSAPRAPVAPSAPRAPGGPSGPRGPVAPCGPCGPAGSCPRLKSLCNSENVLDLGRGDRVALELRRADAVPRQARRIRGTAQRDKQGQKAEVVPPDIRNKSRQHRSPSIGQPHRRAPRHAEAII